MAARGHDRALARLISRHSEDACPGPAVQGATFALCAANVGIRRWRACFSFRASPAALSKRGTTCDLLFWNGTI